MKKGTLILSLMGFILTLFLINQVSAQFSGNLDLGEGMRKILYQVTEFLRPIFELVIGEYSGSEFFYAKVMLLLLLTAIIYLILDKVPIFEGYRGISILTSIIVSVIAVRFIAENDFILGVILPYGTLGIALTTLIPFLIYAYGIHVTGLPGIGRKIAWIIFALVFFALWWTKAPQLNEISNYLYIGILIASAIMVIFDRTIHAYFKGADIRKFEKVSFENQIANLQSDLNYQLRNAGPSPSPEQRRTIERIRRRLRHLGGRYE